jgi:DNA-binding MarR family transcriptional regulator
MELLHDAGRTDPDSSARPGILIRRLHQVHLALFAEECAGFDITAVQYSIIAAIAACPGIDHSQISDVVGVDRATLTNMVGRLEAAGLVARITSRLDRRQKLLSLSPKGSAVLAGMQEAVLRAHARTIAPLAVAEQAQFMALLSRLVDAGMQAARMRR